MSAVTESRFPSGVPCMSLGNGRPLLVASGLPGPSTGGSVALQLEIERPDLVRRMVVAASACRLSEHGRRVQADFARVAATGDARAASASLLSEMAPPPVRYPARGLGWLMGGAMAADDSSDMFRTLEAEDRFDAEPVLHRVRAAAVAPGFLPGA
jgi:pimeloyl-ACP methyl ester carboxylesterase